MPCVFRMNNDNELKSVESGSWFNTLITRSEKNTVGPMRAISLIKFEDMTACPRGRVPLKKTRRI